MELHVVTLDFRGILAGMTGDVENCWTLDLLGLFKILVAGGGQGVVTKD